MIKKSSLPHLINQHYAGNSLNTIIRIMNTKIIIGAIFATLSPYITYAAEAGNQHHRALDFNLRSYASFTLQNAPICVNIAKHKKEVKAVITDLKEMYIPMTRATVTLHLETHGAVLDEDEETLFLSGITIIHKKSTPFQEVIQEAMMIVEDKIQKLEAHNGLLPDTMLKQQMIDEIEVYKDMFLEQNRYSK